MTAGVPFTAFGILVTCIVVQIPSTVADPGGLDTTFGTGGEIVDSLGHDTGIGRAVLLQPDGKIVIAGSAEQGSWLSDFAMIRYLPNGTGDSSFGQNGRVSTRLGETNTSGRGLALQTDGKFLVAGRAAAGPERFDFALARYHTNGALDTAFGSSGLATLGLVGASGVANSVAVQSDGRIVVAGEYRFNGQDRMVVARFLADGSVDTSFGDYGKVVPFIGGEWDSGRSVVIQPDGKMVVGGSASETNVQECFALVRLCPDGRLDDSFATGGKITTLIGGDTYSGGQSLVLQSDGKIVLAGFAWRNGLDIALARYRPDGTLDSGFGEGGMVVTSFTSGAPELSYGAALQSDGKILVTGTSEADGTNCLTVVRYLSNGALDTSFGRDGRVISNFGKNSAYYDAPGRSVAVQRDGKIIAVGGTDVGFRTLRLALARYLGTTEPEIAVEQPAGRNLYDGSENIDFHTTATGREGVTRTFVVRNPSTATLTGLVVNRDGANGEDFSISQPSVTQLGSGESTTFTVTFAPIALGSRTAVLHIASNDADENPFDITLVGAGLPEIAADSPLPLGMVGVPYNFSLAASGDTAPYSWSLIDGSLPSGLSLNSLGSIEGTPARAATANFTLRVSVGDGLAATNAFALTILPGLKPGDLDASFGNAGKVITPIASEDDYGYSVAVQSDGMVLVGGYARTAFHDDYALVRYRPDGTLDNTFGDGGIVTTGVGPGGDYGRSVVVQSDGKILVGGESWNGGYHTFSMVRYRTNGALDATFGVGGRVTNVFGAAGFGKTVRVQGDGKIVLAGEIQVGNSEFGLMRCAADGTLDASFGSGGKVTTDFWTRSFDIPQGAVLQSDGKIVVAGWAPGESGGNDFAVARYHTDGTLDITFDKDGKVTTPIGTGADYGRSVAMQDDGKILVTGEVGRDFGLARYLPDGALDGSFGSGGKVITAIDRFEAFPRDLAVQSDGRIVVAGYTSNGLDYDFALAGYNPDGTLDLYFGTGGKLMTPVGSGHDRARSVAVQSDGRILVAGEAYNGSNYDFALVRYIGSLEPEIAIEQPAGTGLTDGSAIVEFGGADLGATPIDRKFMVRNTGTAVLSGLAVTKEGVHSADFNVAVVRTTSLAPGASLALTVSFSPAALGSRTATLHILSNDSDENPFDITLTGVGGVLSPLQAWRLAHFGNVNDSGDGANANDFDSYGNVNLLEYASGSDPKVPDAAAIRPVATAANNKFLYTFMCDARCTDITYTVQATAGLMTVPWRDVAKSVGGCAVSPEFWFPFGPPCEVSDTGTGLRRVTVAIPATSFANEHGFVRVVVSQ